MAGDVPDHVDLDATRTLQLPPEATPGEAAAVAACLGAYLNGPVLAPREEPEEASRWLLAGRLGSRRPSELPRRVERGTEWKMAGRADRFR